MRHHPAEWLTLWALLRRARTSCSPALALLTATGLAGQRGTTPHKLVSNGGVPGLIMTDDHRSLGLALLGDF
ncbi:hypothetical protein [Halorubrum sp. Ib24]|uniref:hypothetical protein n=1 Tax=Halorubrum sp. Ib24 TaxID=1383850 RepID=UPI0018E9AB00|nr:hypothetical protein [Halorubrum sp. Ib24]